MGGKHIMSGLAMQVQTSSVGVNSIFFQPRLLGSESLTYHTRVRGIRTYN